MKNVINSSNRTILFCFVLLLIILAVKPVFSNNTEAKLVIPEEIQGNWLKTDGSNSWAFGIYKNKFICNSKVWNYNKIIQNKKNYFVNVECNGKTERFFIKKKNNALLIGKTPNKLEKYSATNTYNSKYKIVETKLNAKTFLRADTAYYRGYLIGYNSEEMKAYGKLLINDPLRYKHRLSYRIFIEPNGSFYGKIPINNPQLISVRINGYKQDIYFVPGKETFQLIDLSKTGKSQSLFMGENAKVNSDLNAIGFVFFPKHNLLNCSFLNKYSACEYKTLWKNLITEKENQLQEHIRTNKAPICQTAKTIALLKLHHNAYNHMVQYAYNRNKCHLSLKSSSYFQNTRSFITDSINKDYFTFINPKYVNTPMALITGSAYRRFTNLLYITFLRRTKPNGHTKCFVEEIMMSKAPLNPKVENILYKLLDSLNYNVNKLSLSDKTIWSKFNAEFRRDNPVGRLYTYMNVSRVQDVVKTVGIEKGFLIDLMYYNFLLSSSTIQYTPEDVEFIAKKIENQFVRDYTLNNIRLSSTE